MARFSVSATGTSANVKVGIWTVSVDGSFNTTKIAETASVTPSSTTAVTTATFSSNFTLTAGTQYFVGIATYASTTANQPTFRGWLMTGTYSNNNSHLMILDPVLSAGGAWNGSTSTTALPAISILNNYPFIPWIEIY
jgi:hypothetical protein